LLSDFSRFSGTFFSSAEFKCELISFVLLFIIFLELDIDKISSSFSLIKDFLGSGCLS